jgi:hypothetical protein
MADLEDESRRYKAETQRLSSEIAHLQNEIQNELFQKASCEVEKLAVEDELVNLKHLRKIFSFSNKSLFSFFSIIQMKLI